MAARAEDNSKGPPLAALHVLTYIYNIEDKLTARPADSSTQSRLVRQCMEMAAQLHERYSDHKMRDLLATYVSLFYTDFVDIMNITHTAAFSLKNILRCMHDRLNEKYPWTPLEASAARVYMWMPKLQYVEAGYFAFLQGRCEVNWLNILGSHTSEVMHLFGLQQTELTRCSVCTMGKGTTRHFLSVKFVPSRDGSTVNDMYDDFKSEEEVDALYDLCQHHRYHRRTIITRFPTYLVVEISRIESIIRNDSKVSVQPNVTFYDHCGNAHTYCVNGMTQNAGLIVPKRSHYIAYVEDAEQNWQILTSTMSPATCMFRNVQQDDQFQRNLDLLVLRKILYNWRQV